MYRLPLSSVKIGEGGGVVCTQVTQVERGDKENRRGLGDKKRLHGLASLANFLFAPLHLGACSQDKF